MSMALIPVKYKLRNPGEVEAYVVPMRQAYTTSGLFFTALERLAKAAGGEMKRTSDKRNTWYILLDGVSAHQGEYIIKRSNELVVMTSRDFHSTYERIES